MFRAFVSILLIVSSGTSPDVAAPEGAMSIFQTTKGLADLQKCLTKAFSDIGEVVAVNLEKNSTTLLVRDNPDGPMVIDIAPPSVTVTTRFITGTRKLVQGCI